MGMGGVPHFGISEGKGGLKYGSRPLLGMDIFWNCPMEYVKKLGNFNLPHYTLSRLQEHETGLVV